MSAEAIDRGTTIAADVERTLRHPWERPVFIGTVLLNIAILVAAVWLVAYGSDWLAAHPFFAKRIQQLRGVAIAAVLAAPGFVLIRNSRWADTRANGIRITAAQLPELNDILTRQCATFGIAQPPALYVSDAESNIARAYSAWHREYIVVGTRMLQPDLAAIHDVLAFHIGREIGRLRLGHTVWWDELLVSYVVRIPGLRNPLGHVRAYSADRYGAFLEPDGIRGLIAVAAGRRPLSRIDVAQYRHDIAEVPGLAAMIASWGRRQPSVAQRVRALSTLGLFKN